MTCKSRESDEPRARIGARVLVRRQRWLVTNVVAYEHCELLTLAGVDEGNLRTERQVLAPFERIHPVSVRRRPRTVRPTAWRRACRELIAGDGPATMLGTATTARIDLMPHQLEPVLAVVRGDGSRVLIADEVGLGKTIQAALIATELKSRGAAARVLILAPAGLREQWVNELRSRFDLAPALLDMREIARRRAQLPVGVNPWIVEPLVVSSVDFVKRPEVLPAVREARWDLVIVDEAHHVAATGSDRHTAVASLCSAAAYVVLLTATPHNGDPRAFAALCAIGRHDDTLLSFRRTRHDIGQDRPRRIHQVHVQPNRAERHMHACLAAFVRAVERDRGRHDQHVSLAIATLRKRALSSAFALERSVRRRLDGLAIGSAGEPHQLTLPLEDLGGEFDGADAAPAWTIPALNDQREERTLLAALADAATTASARESKFSALTRLLRRVREPVLIFTEYRDTLLHLRNSVAPDAPVIHGGLTRDERRAALAAFANGRVLLATDAAGEGLNLQQHCRTIVNLELPWNPMRLEQRIGRVDRIGQTRRVHVFHLLAAHTSEVRILQRLAAKVARAQTDVGASDPLGSLDPPASVAPVFLRLQAEANVEHARLSLARRFSTLSRLPARPTDAADECPLVTIARRRRVRMLLAGRTLAIFRSTLADEAGRIVAAHLTAALIDFRTRHPAIDRLLGCDRRSRGRIRAGHSGRRQSARPIDRSGTPDVSANCPF